MTMLPNRYSIRMAQRRSTIRHLRRYTLSQIHVHVHASRLFAVAYGYHQMIPSLSSAKAASSTVSRKTSWSSASLANSILARIRLVNRISTTSSWSGESAELP